MASKVRYIEKIDSAGVKWKCFETRYYAQKFIEEFCYEVDYGLVIQQEDDGFRIYELKPWC